MWIETAVTQFEILSRFLSKETRENHEIHESE
jgi:hypothetical protein